MTHKIMTHKIMTHKIMTHKIMTHYVQPFNNDFIRCSMRSGTNERILVNS